MKIRADAKVVAANRFRKIAEARRDGDRVRLRFGDLTDLAAAVSRSLTTLTRGISGERELAAEIRAEIEDLAGVPLDHIDLPRKTREVQAA